MSNSMLYRILFRELRDGLKDEPDNEFKTLLLKKGLKMSLEELVKFDRNISHPLLMYLESLTILAAEKDYENSIKFMGYLIESHKTLVSRLPNYTEALNTIFVEILATISSNINSMNDFNSVQFSVEYLQNLNINISGILEALVVPYAALISKNIEKIVLPYEVTNKHMVQIIELIDNIKVGINLNLKLDILNDRAADLTIQFIEKDIYYIRILLDGDNKYINHLSMSKRLLNKIKEIGPISEFYVSVINSFSILLGFVTIPETKTITIDYNYPYPEYEVIDSSFSYTKKSYKLKIQTVKLKPSEQIANLKKYSINKKNPLWNPQKFNREIAILERLSLRAKHDNCFLKLHGTKLTHNCLKILIENCTTDLSMLIRSFQSKNLKFKKIQLYQIIFPLIRDFAVLHQQKIYHKDIKPSNILINIVDDNFYPKIADFSCSETFNDESTNSETHFIKGTRDFMPPEFFNNVTDEPIWPITKKIHYSLEKADVFSLGLTILKVYLVSDITCLNLPSKSHFLKDKIENIENILVKTLLSNMLGLEPESRMSFVKLIQFLPKHL